MNLNLTERQAQELMRILMDPGTRVAAFSLDKPHERLSHTACLWEVIDQLSIEIQWPMEDDS